MKRRAAAVLAAVVVCLAAVSLTACGGSGGSSSGSGSSSVKPGRGGSLTVSLATEARGLDPFVASPQGAADGNRLMAIYDVLLRFDPKAGKIEPGLATGATSEDNLTWTLKLREGVTFSDGTPFDAEAVKYTWEQHGVPENGSLQSAALKGDSFTVVDPLTLRITLPEPNAHFDKLIARSVPYIGSPTAMRKGLAEFSKNPVGAGPFVVEEWVRDDHLTLRRNPTYWNAPAPNLDELTFVVNTDEQQRYNAFVAGQTDLMLTQTAETIERANAAGTVVDLHELNGGDALLFNNDRAPFDDVRARQAVAAALSRERLDQVVFGGKGLPGGDLFRENSPFHVPGLAAVDGDTARAQRLLDELAADGKPLRFDILIPSSPLARALGEYLQAALGGLRNIEVGLKTVDFVSYQVKVLFNRDYDLSFLTIRFDDPEPVLWNRLHSDRTDNYVGYHSPAMDAALDRERATADGPERLAALTEVQTVFSRDVPFWLYQQSVVGAIHGDDVAGVEFFNEGTMRVDALGRTDG
ncbi:ABC transporter substrate-binding protein [Frankia sp. CNm7]|uniref:ABC transporter substrate-binding protein n=1 Tax=Frankia nepalensis TaxID=1836974 RepID=A0A937RN31_9ACTN|nr:ABC transporter substrate-binding protein [Frankia nepalensis]MBL7498685.1 ABC transporter substrate-binding protein [Frankia nepalensis]MBL7509150.1 ABC transporter substrate-binding protein [Frankia nepalensis]MBL7518782.1 ABC transporter substrate-binding protein [Frankia nepalensis]MBL7633230.1 ABC transporter substrate-binding protein [Frankia nepalensis]